MFWYAHQPIIECVMSTFILASSRSFISDLSLSAAWANRTFTSDNKSDFLFKSASILLKSAIEYFDPGGNAARKIMGNHNY